MIYLRFCLCVSFSHLLIPAIFFKKKEEIIGECKAAEESSHFVSRTICSDVVGYNKSQALLHPYSHPKFITRLALLIEQNQTPLKWNKIIYSCYLILIVFCLIDGELGFPSGSPPFLFRGTTARALFKVYSSNRWKP